MYQDLLRELAPTYDPRHLEAYMRLWYGVLDHLDREAFRLEVEICAACVDAGGVEAAEKLAQSYGL